MDCTKTHSTDMQNCAACAAAQARAQTIAERNARVVLDAMVAAQHSEENEQIACATEISETGGADAARGAQFVAENETGMSEERVLLAVEERPRLEQICVARNTFTRSEWARVCAAVQQAELNASLRSPLLPPCPLTRKSYSAEHIGHTLLARPGQFFVGPPEHREIFEDGDHYDTWAMSDNLPKDTMSALSFTWNWAHGHERGVWNYETNAIDPVPAIDVGFFHMDSGTDWGRHHRPTYLVNIFHVWQQRRLNQVGYFDPVPCRAPAAGETFTLSCIPFNAHCRENPHAPWRLGLQLAVADTAPHMLLDIHEGEWRSTSRVHIVVYLRSPYVTLRCVRGACVRACGRRTALRATLRAANLIHGSQRAATTTPGTFYACELSSWQGAPGHPQPAALRRGSLQLRRSG